MNCVKYLYIITLLLLPLTGFTQLVTPVQTIKIAEGTTITLRANSSNAQYFQWFRDGSIITDAISEQYAPSQSGSYTVMAFNSASCTSNLSDPVIIIVEPKLNKIADLNISKRLESQSIKLNDEITYTLTVNNKGPDMANNVVVQDPFPIQLEFVQIPAISGVKSSYNTSTNTATWEISTLKKDEALDLKLIAKIKSVGKIENTAFVKSMETDPNPKDNIDSALADVYGIKIPNVFTPNFDGKNDYFEIPGLENYPDNEITILNRWGNHVFEQKPYAGKWTGERLNEGTYFYVLTINQAGKRDIFKGYITLIRDKKK
ncbi:T9SS type B sorting domain-containing protein [Pseudopedobacter saltans]|uniref:T9SS type B sorting domain-containing protein n=1 Tax=Pseudopedobacter saltans TaxID=151895 RepID=UPI00145D0DED|nr:gliding motility-associated C-terminal domain-containing protein [Pseudopedobacter saltans]